MTRYPILFDGHDLTDGFVVSWEVQRGLTPWEPTLIGVPGRSGQLVGGTHATALEVQMRLFVMDCSRDVRQERLRKLAAWLAVDEPKPLVLGDEGGRYRMAMPTGETPITPYLNGDGVEVTFVCPDPVLYGRERTVVVPSTGSKELTWVVGGSAPTMPTVSATVTAAQADLYWRLGLDDGSYLAYYPPYKETTLVEDIVANCERRIFTRDGYADALPLNADWLTLTPGEHTLTLGGTASSGDVTVTYRERWW